VDRLFAGLEPAALVRCKPCGHGAGAARGRRCSSVGNPLNTLTSSRSGRLRAVLPDAPSPATITRLDTGSAIGCFSGETHAQTCMLCATSAAGASPRRPADFGRHLSGALLE